MKRYVKLCEENPILLIWRKQFVCSFWYRHPFGFVNVCVHCQNEHSSWNAMLSCVIYYMFRTRYFFPCVLWNLSDDDQNSRNMW